MKIVSLFFTSLLLCLSGFAQEKLSLYGDGGGASPVMSINIDKRLFTSNRGIGLRVGIGLVPAQTRVLGQFPRWIKDGSWKVSVPVAINYLLGNPKQVNFLELALQGTYIPKATIVDSWSSLKIEDERIINRFMPSAFFGYRRNPVVKGIVFRIGYNPLILDEEVVHWFSASLGWKFKK